MFARRTIHCLVDAYGGVGRIAKVMEAVAEERAANEDCTGAVTAWRRLAAEDPCDARIAVRLMEALEAAGNRAGALQRARIHAHPRAT